MLDRPGLFCKLEDAHANNDLLHLPDGEAIGIDIYAIRSLKSCKDAGEVVDTTYDGESISDMFMVCRCRSSVYLERHQPPW